MPARRRQAALSIMSTTLRNNMQQLKDAIVAALLSVGGCFRSSSSTPTHCTPRTKEDANAESATPETNALGNS